MYQRLLKLADIVSKKSVLLFGPRQVGKSTLLKTIFPGAPTYNLLDTSTYRSLNINPALIRSEVTETKKRPDMVIIDEIQLLPQLLNEVHLMIEEYKIKFILTGSSARSLKRKGVNLLAGRARTKYLHPLVTKEIGPKFDLMRAINYGTLPFIYDSDSPDEDLSDYCGSYLKEEVAAEGIVRNIPAFSRFLMVAARSNGSLLNYTNIANDAQVKRTTVVDYFQILRDTLIGFDLEPWVKSTSRKPIETSKFYIFDPGIQRHLGELDAIKQKSPLFGQAFEHFIFRELKSALDYGYIEALNFWRSKSGFEVDFILNESIAVECKATTTVRSEDLKGLKKIQDENIMKRYLLICFVEKPQRIGSIEVMNWKTFLEVLWQKGFI